MTARVQSPGIGYLVGGFPNAAHTYFWREVAALRRMGVQVEFCSTRRPALPAHAWAEQAARDTQYLLPLAWRRFVRGQWDLLTHPRRTLGVIRSIFRASDLTAKQRLKCLAYVPLAAMLKRLAQERAWSHIHSGFCNDTANLALYAYLLGGPTYSVSLHCTLEELGPNQRAKWGNAAFGTVITQKLKQELVAAIGEEQVPHRLGIAPMGVDLEIFRRQQPYKAWAGRGPLRVFTCCRIVPSKGLDTIIEAVAALRKAGVDARLTVAGEAFPKIDWYLKLVEQKVAEHGLEGHVTQLGAVSEERVRDELEGAHVFVLGSHNEGLGIAIAEAMAMGVPVVATHVGGIPELVRHDVDGLLVPAGDSPAMATAMREIADSSGRAMRFSISGRHRVEQHFHADRSAQVMLANLQAIGAVHGAQAVEPRIESGDERIAANL